MINHNSRIEKIKTIIVSKHKKDFIIFFILTAITIFPATLYITNKQSTLNNVALSLFKVSKTASQIFFIQGDFNGLTTQQAIDMKIIKEDHLYQWGESLNLSSESISNKWGKGQHDAFSISFYAPVNSCEGLIQVIEKSFDTDVFWKIEVGEKERAIAIQKDNITGLKLNLDLLSSACNSDYEKVFIKLYSKFI